MLKKYGNVFWWWIAIKIVWIQFVLQANRVIERKEIGPVSFYSSLFLLREGVSGGDIVYAILVLWFRRIITCMSYGLHCASYAYNSALGKVVFQKFKYFRMSLFRKYFVSNNTVLHEYILSWTRVREKNKELDFSNFSHSFVTIYAGDCLANKK